jgi:putative transposase
MSAAQIELHPGAHVHVQREGGRPELWKVLKRKRKGWLVQLGDQDAVTWSDDHIHDLRLNHAVELYAADPEADEHVAYCLSKAFEAFPEDLKTIALRRAEYVREVDDWHGAGETLEESYVWAALHVFEAFEGEWREEDVAYAAALAERRRQRQRKAATELKRQKKGQPLVVPKPRTVELWYRTWITHDRDIRVLLPDFRGRGDRTQRYAQWIYVEMRAHIEKYYLVKDRRRPPLTYAYGKFEGHCRAKGLDADKPRKKGEPRPYPTYAAFRTFKNGLLDAREEMQVREGGRKAYLTFNVFRKTDPLAKVMAEVEFDHSLVDLIVVDEQTGRAIGRPWFTAALDRASRMLIGCHLSFEVPSYAALQRCMGHAFWPKDLRGIEGLSNPWPCEGIPQFAFVDNGKEFRSKSLRRSETAMNFRIRPLPVMAPWLKGKLERLFGRFNAQVYAHREGKTFHSAVARGDYNSIKRAETTLPQLRRDLLDYIVDDYHVTRHRTLEARPLDVWNDLVARNGGIRAVPSHSQIIELIGQVRERPIGNTGIHLEGLNFHSDRLTALRERRGGRQKLYQVRFDPFDLWRIWVLDEETGEHIPVDCTNQAIARNVSIFAAGLHLQQARSSGAGRFVTERDILLAKQRVEEESDRILCHGGSVTTAAKVARYRYPNGDYFTPVGPRNAGQPDSAKHAPAAERAPAEAAPVAPETPSGPAPTAAAPSASSLHESLTEDLDALMDEWSRA